MRRALGWFLPRREREHLLGEMDDLWARRARDRGRRRASLWYARHAAGFAWRMSAAALGGRGRRGGAAAAGVGRDLAYGVRVLRRRPGYALAAVLTLGVGLGGVGAVYGAANWVMLRPVPGVTADRLVTLRMEVGPGSPGFPLSQPDLEAMRAGLPGLEGLEASWSLDVHLDAAVGEGPVRASAEVVTPGWFRLLGVGPARGRLVEGGPAEEPAVAVVSHRLWKGLLGGDPEIVGRTVRLNGKPFTVIGVTPPGFRGAELPGGSDLWVPARAAATLDPALPADVLGRRDHAVWTDLVGRLAPGAAYDAIPPASRAVMERVRSEYRFHSFAAAFTVMAYPGVGLAPRVRDGATRTLGVLAVTAGLLLLLAVANVSNLTLSHAASRDRTVAVHAALGAGRARIARGILLEHLLLGVAGAGAGLALAWAGTRIFHQASVSSLGGSLEGLRLDGRVAAFVALASVMAALLAAAGPVAAAGRRGALERLQGARQGTPGSRRTRALLVMAQVAVSAAMLVGATLLTRTVSNLRGEPLGFEPDAAARFAVDPRLQGLGERESALVLERISRALGDEPGVVAAGFASPTPLSASYLTFGVRRPGAPDDDPTIVASQLGVTPGFLEAMGARLLAGRLIRAVDLEGTAFDSPGAPVVVVTRSLARRVYPEVPIPSVVGRTLERSYGEVRTRTIVGVIDDVRLVGFGREPPPVALLPWGQGASAGPAVGWARTVGGPRALASRIPSILREVAPELPPFEVRTVRAQVDTLIVEERVVARLALALGLIGLGLAGIGLYGVLAHAVAERTREIGVRIALGASSRSLLGRVLARGLLLTAAGTFVGLAAALPLARLLRSRLFGIEPADPVAFVGAAVVLVGVAAVASLRPARRATRVSPREALMAE